MHRSTTVMAISVVLLTLVLALPAGAAQPAGTTEPTSATSVERAPAARTPLAGNVRIALPRRVSKGRLTNVRLTLPARVAAIDGRLLVAKNAATLMGVAVYGAGTALRPVAIKGGHAFGAYGLKPRAGSLIVDLVILPERTGKVGLRVIVDSAAAADGGRVTLRGGAASGTVAVGDRTRRMTAPAPAAAPTPLRAGGPVTEALTDGRIDRRDMDLVRAAWEEARARGRTCGSRTPGDRNGDGCTDAVDLQAVAAAQGTRLGGGRRASIAADDETTRRHVVTSTEDTPDASPGDGVCADSEGRCTLRAAITEGEYLRGDDRITFDLPGGAPVTIQINGRLPYITSRSGSLVINGYTQPGAQVNTATHGSNAVPGVVLRGNGTSAREVGLFITSGDNVVRGLAFTNLWRGVFIDGPNAARNRIVGNWFGYDGLANSQSLGDTAVVLNVGARDNVIGGPDLADRNVMGQWRKAMELYGPGTDGNVIQGNQLCIKPGGATSFCQIGIDANFGPKGNLIGGDGDGERNVVGPTSQQGFELSHGWDTSLPGGGDPGDTWLINDNRIIGNWVGFRANGSYDPDYRSGSQASTGDNANGINVYDGTNDNVVARNHIASVFDGIQVMSSNTRGNDLRGNVIGESPQGEPARLTGWGIIVRWGARYTTLANNTIRNAERGGVGLLNVTNYGSLVAVAHNTRISRTIVTGTDGPAIHLAPNPDDPTRTANDTTPPPAIEYATPDLVTGTAIPGATVEVFRATRGVNASGLPAEFLGDAVVAGNGTWTVAVNGLEHGQRVTALQVRTDENTSELSGNVEVGDAPAPPPPPDPDQQLALDAFDRTVASGWGTADVGGDWTMGRGNYGVEDGAGRMVVGAADVRDGRLRVGAADVIVIGQVTFDRLPVGGSAFAYALARADATTGIRGSIRVAPNGRVFVQLKRVIDKVESNIEAEVNTGLVAVPGEPIGFRMRVVGEDLRLRVWLGPDEPSEWQTTATDSTVMAAGDAGLMGYLGRNASNGPMTVSLDEFQVRAP